MKKEYYVWGVIYIKKNILLVIAVIAAILLASCGAPEQTAGEISGTDVSESASETMTLDGQDKANPDDYAESWPGEAEEQETGQVEEATFVENADTDLLQSANVDLDGDGINEIVEAVRTVLPSSGTGMAGELEGWLLVKSGTEQRRIRFCKKAEDLSGLLTGWQFEDLDGDGAQDVFIIIPGYGASFSYSNYFIYSYKKGLSYSFTSDNMLADFISGFEPSYIKGGNKLTLVNSNYNFSADIAIEGLNNEVPEEETMLDYANRTWIEPVAVDIDDDSKLALVKGAGNKPEIKVPLPIFGMATVDMIGEIDLYYNIDNSFKPVLKHFEIFDFTENGKTKAGSCDVQ